MSETASRNQADDAPEFGGMRAPDALAAALRMAGADVSPAHVATATDYLAKAGTPVSIRKGGKEKDPPFAFHVPVTTDGPLNFSYSAAGSPGHENCCDPGGYRARPRGVYQDDRLISPLPYVWSIAVAKNGRTSITNPIMSATKNGPRAAIAWDDIRTGTWADALNTGLSPDRRIITAVAAAITELAHGEHTPQHPAAVTPAARTDTGHIPAPVAECMPGGYWEQPADPGRLQARATQAEIAARRPKIALTWGASIGAVFAGPLKLRQSGIWELTGGPRKGKTTALMLGASAWGYPEFPPDGMLISWDQTSKGTGRHLGELGIFPAFMDETGTADFGPDEWARLTYSLSLGASRKTAKTRGSMGTNQTPGWQGFLFTTGNSTMTDGATAGKFAGVPARVVTLSGEFTGSHEECAALDAAVLADYGWLGPEVIRTVSVDEFGEMYRRALADLGAPAGGIIGTLAGKAALAVAGAEAIDRVLGTGTRIRDAALAAALDYLANLANPETDRERILRDLAESMSAERSAWADQAGYDAWGTQLDKHRARLAGLHDEAWLYVYPATWEALIKQAGITGSASLALADMHDRGELHVPASRRKRGEWKAPAPRWASSPEVYKIQRAAVEAVGQDPDETTMGDGGDGPSPTCSDGGDGGTPTRGDGGSAPTLTSGDGGDGGDGGQNLTRTRTHAREGTGHQDQAPAPDPFGAWPADSAGATANGTAPTAPATADPEPNPEDAKSPAHREGNSPMTATTTTTSPRTAFLADVRTRKPFDRPACLEALKAACDALDATGTGKTPEELEAHARTLKLADAMVGSDRKAGPFAPRLAHKAPWWQPWQDDLLLATISTVMAVPGYAYRRPYTGPVTILDRNAAQIAAMASVAVAHGALTRTGPADEVPRYPAPGYYKVHVYPWTEDLTPSPLGPAPVDGETWIPAPTMGLLRELAMADRWPDAGALDSWTGEPCRLTDWARLFAEVRAYALTAYNRGSDPFDVAKKAFSQAKSLMLGSLDPASAVPRRKWKHFNHRTDWGHHVIAQGSATMWRTADQCGRITGPDLAPVALRATDELAVPTAALESITSVILPGRKTPSVRIDPTTIGLGTFKIQNTEDW